MYVEFCPIDDQSNVIIGVRMDVIPAVGDKFTGEAFFDGRKKPAVYMAFRILSVEYIEVRGNDPDCDVGAICYVEPWDTTWWAQFKRKWFSRDYEA